jgi:hypothetical protein
MTRTSGRRPRATLSMQRRTPLSTKASSAIWGTPITITQTDFLMLINRLTEGSVSVPDTRGISVCSRYQRPMLRWDINQNELIAGLAILNHAWWWGPGDGQVKYSRPLTSLWSKISQILQLYFRYINKKSERWGDMDLLQRTTNPDLGSQKSLNRDFFSFASKEENVELFSKAFSSSYAIP